MLALSQIKAPLSSIALFHSDRGKEFDNQLLDITTFNHIDFHPINCFSIKSHSS